MDPEQIKVIDRAKSIGGRVATLGAGGGAEHGLGDSAAHFGGYVIDCGFQVLLSSYPTARKLLDFNALDMCWFDNGALLARGGGVLKPWYAPTRHPIRGLASLFAGALPLVDQLRIGRLMASWVARSDTSLVERFNDQSIAEIFTHNHLTGSVLEEFLRPFYGGVLLDDNLGTSAALAAIYGKRFALGRAGVPRRGMAEIPRQLAAHLPEGMLLMETEVVSLRSDGGQPLLGLVGGGEIRPDRVVLATDPWTTAQLLGIEPPKAREVTAVYFSSDRPLYAGKLLLLFPGKGRWVRHAVQVSNINTDSAPAGRHLFCATVLQSPAGMTDEAVFSRVLADLAEFLPDEVKNLKPLVVVRVARAVPAQGPDLRRCRVGWQKACPPGVELAGDMAASASIEGVLSSGVAAARQLFRPI